MKHVVYSFLVDDSSEQKKVKSVNKNVIEKLTYSDWKSVLLKKECLRHSINRIQS